jgi:hypothetical protein
MRGLPTCLDRRDQECRSRSQGSAPNAAPRALPLEAEAPSRAIAIAASSRACHLRNDVSSFRGRLTTRRAAAAAEAREMAAQDTWAHARQHYNATANQHVSRDEVRPPRAPSPRSQAAPRPPPADAPGRFARRHSGSATRAPRCRSRTSTTASSAACCAGERSRAAAPRLLRRLWPAARPAPGAAPTAPRRFAYGAPALLDLACGRGGDLQKWKECKVGACCCRPPPRALQSGARRPAMARAAPRARSSAGAAAEGAPGRRWPTCAATTSPSRSWWRRGGATRSC